MSLIRAFTVLLSIAGIVAAAPPLPNEIFRRGQGEECAVTPQYQPEWYERNLRTVRKIYDLTVYPNNIPVLLQGGAAVPKGLFSNDSKGRVSPVGNFVGFEDSIEYFFALAPTPQGNPAGAAVYDAQVVNFVSGCPDVASSLVYLRTGQVNQLGQLNKSAPTSTLSQLASGVDYSNMQVQQAAVQGLCPVIQQRCTGSNQQYTSVQDCGQQLGAKPFGNFDEAWGDNIACRTIHLILTVVHPEVHCPHVGPTGGGKCSEIDYSVDYFDDDKLFQAPVGSVFTCSGPLQPDNQVGAGPGAGQILQQLAQLAASGKLPAGVAQMMGGGGAGGAQGGAVAGAFNPLGQSGGGAMPGTAGLMGGQQMPPANGMNNLPAGAAGAAGAEGAKPGAGGQPGQTPSAAMAGAMGGVPQGASGQTPPSSIAGATGKMSGTSQGLGSTPGQMSPPAGGATGAMPQQEVPPGYCPCAPGQQSGGHMGGTMPGSMSAGSMASANAGSGSGTPQGIQPAGMQSAGMQPAGGSTPQGVRPASMGCGPPQYGSSSSGSTPASPAQQQSPPHMCGDVNGAQAPPDMGYSKGKNGDSGSQHQKKWSA
ncbi:Hypothetical predicted protein [Lecanosticta acicola]|uniref:Uncharacterized protein n=1 Tax=Lecanosticta acicola TaxID=111012 RepID=A0AAI9EBV0_9PEZI|nr:Hypothetical predicted protein [Lecanosticta acicola]